MPTPFYDYLKTLTELSNLYPIDDDKQLIEFHDIFLNDIRMNNLRTNLKIERGDDRVECAEALREYEKVSVDKYLRYKNKLNVV